MKNNFVKSKQRVKDFYDKVKDATVGTIDTLIEEYYHEDVVWNGPQPFNTLKGRKALAEKFWKPYMRAMPDLQKNTFMHLAGNNHFANNNEWIVSSGHYVGSFDNDFVDIPASKGITWICYIEFNRLKDNKIIETYTIIDMLDLIRQAGISFVPALAPEVIIPGPSSNDGVIMDTRDEEESKKSLQIIHDMAYKALSSYQDTGLGKMGLEDYFTENFIWFGPCGIGTTRGLEGFRKYHQKPFLDALPDRNTYPDFFRVCFAEGNYGALIEWEGFWGTHKGGSWLGMPPSNKKIVMRDADLYLIQGDKIAENWCYMDVVDVLLQMDVDVFERLRDGRYIKLN